jgi:GcrA cell cycle regulator
LDREQEDELISLLELGQPASKIGLAIGKSRNAVIGKARRMGLHLNLPAWQKIPAVEREKKMLTRKPPAVEPVVVAPPPDLPGAYTFAELREWSCRWPSGSSDAGNLRFCGARRAAPKPYCVLHCRLAYYPVRR